MADESPSMRPSAGPTRRSSDASVGDAQSTSDHPSHNASVSNINSGLLADSGRRRPHMTSSQTEGYGI